MPFIPHSDVDIQIMLTDIGESELDHLFNEIPSEIPLAAIDAMTSGMSENEIVRLSTERAPNIALGSNFIGAGAYEHAIPAAVWDIVTRGEFYTAYTPYQPEASQGTLEAIFEYQSMMTALMAMEVSNASLYEGASALAEAVLMAARIKNKDKTRVLVPDNLHPHYRDVLNTIINANNINLIDWPYDPDSGCLDATALQTTGADVVIISQPNFFGGIEAVDALTKLAHQQNALVIAVVNPIAMACYQPPGLWGDTGADIACGEGQPLGVPLAGGGPYFGFLCCRKKDIRQLPGRIVGKTVDAQGRVGYVLTLQAREQHIRRAKATSNICTNQGLLMTAATIYMKLLGGKGLQEVALRCQQNCDLLKEKLSAKKGVKIRFSGKTFHEVVLEFDQSLETLMKKFNTAGIQAGFALEKYFPSLKNCLLVCVTETKLGKDIDKFLFCI